MAMINELLTSTAASAPFSRDLGAMAVHEHQVGRADRHHRSVDTTIDSSRMSSRDPFHGRATVAANAGRPGTTIRAPPRTVGGG